MLLALEDDSVVVFDYKNGVTVSEMLSCVTESPQNELVSMAAIESDSYERAAIVFGGSNGSINIAMT